ncbi:hypothetical protein ASPZODRAFT_111904 [Penicilliopsis zonata CBS 506.65]|uniref:ubiquitinyl hydrolase 1 n=1 Tax=Penicilliopsis zonata CBS 506.65 TaxID=1073090 RepID=A0A1L9SQ27_9EURO|nr:hypothetical protein ASPZODRAFT_111904 [Penicilliopsis zonata CBS 506.65]OJJ49211.1 hypothetical protein ASPZODRAFT_111904 [Penicilliopsis zonata CBS 506.65]
MSSAQRPGKTSPRLAQDICLYDPLHIPGTRRNLLSEVPPVYPEGYDGPPDYISPTACRHEYVTKTSQSFFPEPEHRWRTGVSTRLSAMCVRCRYHLQVVTSHTNGGGQYGQTSQDHVHHWMYSSGRQRDSVSAGNLSLKEQTAESFHYRCSYITCSTVVSVRIVSPVLSQDWVRLLTDPELLSQRAEEAIAAHPERLEGFTGPQPITVLEDLRSYLSNALHDPKRSKSISAINKRFMVCFGMEGQPCKDLLEFLGFSVKKEGFWEPPRPDPSEEVPYQDTLRIFLDDVVHELSALIDQRPLSEKRGHQLDHFSRSFLDDLYYTLEALDYPKATRANDFSMPGAPFYEDLGVVEDMPSAAIVEAFNRQVSVDPARTPLYFGCLKEIGALRGGDDAAIIERAVEAAYAEGKYTNEDVANAYKYFSLNSDDSSLTDENIIGRFHAFLNSTTQENESRKQLWRIGDSRRSERIKSAAEDRVSTVEQAHMYLGVDERTSDDFIITMYTTKINDSPSSKDFARRAVELIAEARKSDVLKHYLKTGEMGVGEMDVGDAYRLLQIPDRTVDDAAIVAAYTICIDEAPSQAETYNRALSIIAKEKNSPLLSTMVFGSTPQSDRVLSEWPVGLQNIGNTCYLNSLLQFYFSIRPFREMVLDFDSYKMSLDEESLSKKQVGSRKVSKKEIERSQRFLRELQVLFQNMISSSQPSVTPGQELARLTLISPSNEAAIRRMSTRSRSRSVGLGELNGMPIIGPLGPPQQEPETKEPVDLGGAATLIEAPEKLHVTGSGTSDADSEATLVSEGARPESQTLPADDKENTPPSSDEDMKDAPESIAPETKTTDGHPAPQSSPVEPPDRPPPVPPRPVPQTDRQKQLIDEVEIGAQQDVTEVINNVLFQSQCAVRPSGFDANGEQLDRVKDLFYGRTKSYISAAAGVRSKEELWCDIKVDVASGPRDIYSAIDGAFDVQKVDVEGAVAEQYGAISKLPPVLQIQVQRVQFDPVKKSSFKSTHHLELLDTIYMDRYMDTQNLEILNRRRECWQWKNKLKTLEARRDELLRKDESDKFDMPTLFDSAKIVLEDLLSMKDNPETSDEAIDIDPQLVTELEQLSQMTQTELTNVEQEMKNTQTMIATQFADSKHLAYRLYAVFVHHGSVTFGHYYIYIFDFRKEVWRKYNDNDVTEVHNAEEIFKNSDRQNPPTPYFLVYVHDALKDRLADPVCREILDAASSSLSPPPPLPPSSQAPPPPLSPAEVAVVTDGPEDIEMRLPSYEEVQIDTPSGTRTTGPDKNHTASATGQGWPSSTQADLRDVKW